MEKQMDINDFKGKVVKEVKIENTTILLEIPKSEASKLRKEIRHRLDSKDHSIEKGQIEYVKPEFSFKTISHKDTLEVLIYHVKATVHINKYTSNPSKRVRNILEKPESVLAVGHMEVRESYTREI